MKKIKSLLVVALVLAAAVLTNGCLSLTSAISEGAAHSDFRKALSSESYAGLTPENSVVIFGSGYYSMTLLKQNGTKGLYYANGASTSGLFTSNAYFLFKPIALGTELKVYSYSYSVGDGTMTIYGGIAGVDIVPTKPGLYYYDANDKDHKYEKDSLEELGEYYKGSAWEQLIKDRIQELKK